MKTQGIHASIIQELDFSSLDLFLIRWLRFIFIVSIGAREFMVVINYITNNTIFWSILRIEISLQNQI